MARKKLLSEGEVRQFMKLADLGALSENYFSSTPIEEESEESALHATEDELGAEDRFADEEGDELGALEDELPEEEGELSLSDDEALAIIDLAARLEAAMGGDVEGGDELEVDAELEEPLPGGGELEVDEELPGNYNLEEYALSGDPGPVPRTPKSSAQRPAPRARDPKTACAAGEHWVADSAHPKGGSCERGEASAQRGTGTGGLEEDAIVAEVARRVAERLSADKRQEKMADQLAERIFDRLTAK
jgi:hypothetical protein